MQVGFGGCCVSFEFDWLTPSQAFSLHRRQARAIFAFRHRMLFLCVMKAAISKPLKNLRFYKQKLQMGKLYVLSFKRCDDQTQNPKP